MSVYLLCIQPPYHHARSYVGWTPDATVNRRVNEHLSGGCKASPLVAAALMAGHTVGLARAWEGAEYNRKFERHLKRLGGQSKRNLCPHCRQQGQNGGAA
jgi:predicted GIY-YIG superfamily endonuclease